MVLLIGLGFVVISSIATGTAVSRALGACLPRQKKARHGTSLGRQEVVLDEGEEGDAGDAGSGSTTPTTEDDNDHEQREEEPRVSDAAKIAEWHRRRALNKPEPLTEETFVPSFGTAVPSDMSLAITRDMCYKAPDMRVPGAVAPPSSVGAPNVRDILRRVAVVLHHHIDICERGRHEAEERDRAVAGTVGGRSPDKPTKTLWRAAPSLPALVEGESALWGVGSKYGTHAGAEQSPVQADGFSAEMAKVFDEENFVVPTLSFMYGPTTALPGNVLGFKEVRPQPEVLTVDAVLDFISNLFTEIRLSSECSLVCLIYVERLMETARVPLLRTTWKPAVLCGLLLASKVWQDLGGWNVEFANVCPKYSLKNLNRLEQLFLGAVKWDMSVSSSLYARYYFAVRSLTEKQDFRHRYNRLLQIDALRASTSVGESDLIKHREGTHTRSDVSLLSRSL